MEIFLATYSIAFLLIVVVARVYFFRRRTGTNPVILGDAQSAHGYVGRVAKMLVLVVGVVMVLRIGFPVQYELLMPFQFNAWLGSLGVAILIVTLVLTAWAQSQMGDSWRIGIETKDKTEIVRRGLYRFSRNPIYVGLYLSNIGLFLVVPNVVTLVVFVLGHVLLQLIVRLEEAHLHRLHGAAFDEYCSQVRRWI